MASLENLRYTRDRLQNIRLFHYTIGVMTIAAWAYVFFLVKAHQVALQVLFLCVIAANIFAIWIHTKFITGLDDFIVFHTIRYMEKHDVHKKMMKFEKKRGFAKKDVENLRQKQKNPDDWHIEDTKKEFYLVEDAKKNQIL